MENSEKVIYFSINELAKETDIGNATIVRFCRKLGFNGYQEFKVKLAQEKTRYLDNNVLSGTVEKDDSIEKVAQKFFNVNIESLKRTLEILNYQEIQAIANRIKHSKKIHLIGYGHSGIAAIDTKYKFMRIGINCDVYTDEHTMLMMASIMSSDDFILSISHSGNTHAIIKTLQVAKDVGAVTAMITGEEQINASSYLDHFIQYVSPETFFQTGSLATKVAQFFLIDLIYTEVVRLFMDTAIEKKIKTATTVSEQNI